MSSTTDHALETRPAGVSIRSFEQAVILVSVLVVLVGGVFRFVGLDQKVYWHDETITSIRISGYPYGPFVDTIPAGQWFSVPSLQRYQQVSGNGVLATARSLADGDPQHPPLYYEIARLWGKTVGDSVTSLRALSAVISVLALAAMFLFCRALFGSRLAGWLGAAVLAASPFQLFYAQEAREYALWVLLTLVSSLALLLALRRPGEKRRWVLYGVALLLSLYTFVLSAFLIAAHAIVAAAAAKRSRLKQVAVPFSTCLGVVTALFSPWLLVIYRHRAAIAATNDWTKQPIPRLDLLQSWLGSLGLDFVATRWTGAAETLVFLPFLALTVYAAYVLLRNRHVARLTVASLFVAAALPLMLADVVLGGQRSSTARYLIPALLAIQLAVVYLLTTKLADPGQPGRAIWSCVALVVVGVGLGSWANSIDARTWPLKDDGGNRGDLFAARVVNAEPHPMLVATVVGRVLVLTHLLHDDVRVALATRKVTPTITPSAAPVFLYGSSNGGGSDVLELLKARYERAGYRVVPVAGAPTAGRVSPKPQVLRVLPARGAQSAR